MEEMLQNFTNLGKTDIAFLVVNSKNERSEKLLPLLKARVSFPVYQETYDEEVWSVLGGGKDDMFIYDRCGRLVAYVPFPLSLLDKDRSLVSHFILQAYHIDPCSEETPCSDTETDAAIQDIEDKRDKTGFLNNTQEDNYEEQNLINRINETYSEDKNELLWPDINETVQLRSNSSFHPADHFSENISHFETQNHTVLQDIHNTIWETQNLDDNNTANTSISTTDILSPSIEPNVTSSVLCSNTHTHSNNVNPAKSFDTNDINDLTFPATKPTDTPKATDTTRANTKRICAAEDEKVCEQWTKRQLKRIQTCCAKIDADLKDEVNSRHNNMCKSFQRKRCKKLRTVIKCCLKIYDSDDNYESTDEVQSSRRQDTLSIESQTHNNKDAENAVQKVS